MRSGKVRSETFVDRLLRLLTYATYPFLVLSPLLLVGLAFGMVYVCEFTVENRAARVLVVTPVGRSHETDTGERGPLPVRMIDMPALPALRSGGFRLEPGESVTIGYDSDEVTLTEIVVAIEGDPELRFVTLSGGSTDRPLVIDARTRLEPAYPNLVEATQLADRQ